MPSGTGETTAKMGAGKCASPAAIHHNLERSAAGRVAYTADAGQDRPRKQDHLDCTRAVGGKVLWAGEITHRGQQIKDALLKRRG